MPEMDELFYKNVYLKEFDETVLSCTESRRRRGTFEVVLSDTAFYPEGGGQPADLGTLETEEDGPVHVLDVQRVVETPASAAAAKGDIIHYAGSPLISGTAVAGSIVHFTDRPLTPGTAVHGVIDWARRFDHMQNHSGEHIISGLVHKHYGYENVGYHMGDVITIDLSGPLTWGQLMEIEREADEVVYSDRPIEITFPSPEELAEIPYRSKKELTGRVRIVTIPGADICACCGTHVARTGEIGLIKCLSMINYKGGVRIEMASGSRALRIVERRMDALTQMAREMAAGPDDAPEALGRIRQESLEKSRLIAERTRMYYAAKADSMGEKRTVVTDFEEELDPVETRRFCEFLLEQERGTVCLVASKQGEGWYFVIGSRTVDVRPGGKEMNSRLQGRGGGKPEMIQGTFHASPEEIRAAAEDIFHV